MLDRKKRQSYSRKGWKNRRRKIRIFCIHVVVVMIVTGAVTLVFRKMKNSWSSLCDMGTVENSSDEIYVIQASTEEEVSSTVAGDREGHVTSVGASFAPQGLLVNKWHPLPENYEVALHRLNNGQLVAELMYEDLRDMLFTGEEEEGISFIVCSGYRETSEQNQLLEDEIAKNQATGMSYEEAKADALLTVAPPGCSEHETGLAVDIVAETNQRLDDTQEWTRENQWLQENCYKYGFILRYPKGKEDITGFSYESWHFRYVGKEAAKEIMEQGITLEEYLE